jgi:hypothetical protein
MSSRRKSDNADRDASNNAFDPVEYLHQELQRQVGDRLIVTQIPGTHSFRVNWHDMSVRRKSAQVGLSIPFIRKSAFLHCRLGNDGAPQITYPARQ